MESLFNIGVYVGIVSGTDPNKTTSLESVSWKEGIAPPFGHSFRGVSWLRDYCPQI